MAQLHLVSTSSSCAQDHSVRGQRGRALDLAHRIVAEWLASDLDDPDQVYPELERRIATALARRDAEIARLRSGCACHGEDAPAREEPTNSGLTVANPLR